jgi:hypothetical protein
MRMLSREGGPCGQGYFCTLSVDSPIGMCGKRRHAVGMDVAEIKRLEREIHRSYGSSPHKKKVWLALLEMYAGREIRERKPRRKATADETTGSVPIDFRQPGMPPALHTIRR